ncbi:hypothetical protein AaE_016059 [Aphanomyces astaci]|uniref:HTH CENPB-type domain-containing protein n=1 Tax=Aphanomyces astaci TaxID=112090 RepID=A0A6A4YZN7_APHAT|nr:hypothetical protein AaE_016059 [Aphanomyces astaci]
MADALTGRPSTKQIKRMPKKHKNLYHTYEKKLHIFNWRKEHSMESAIDTFFPGVAGDKRTTVWKQILRWESQRDHITMACSKARTRDMRTLRKQGISTTLTRVAEENIAQWVLFTNEAPSRATVVSWITSVWTDLPEPTIVNGFKACDFIDADLMENLAVEAVINPTSVTDNLSKVFYTLYECMLLKARTRDMRTLRKQGISTTPTRVAEEKIAQWVSELREDGIPVSKTLLACKAMDVALEQGLAVNQFKASPSWMKGFMKRWGLAIRAKTRSGQANLADGEKALAEFKTSIRKVIKDNRIVEVFNADQTGINYEYLPKQTMDKKGAKTVWIKASGHDKDRVTAMILADSKGTKYPPFLVLKSKASTIKAVVQENLTQRHGFGRQVWKEIEDLEANFPLQIYGNPSAWWNAGISLRFLDFHFGHRRGQDVDPVLLLWDDFSAHFTDEVFERA